MNTSEFRAGANICVWVVATEPWEPASPFDEPASRRVLFPALDRSLTNEEAAAFVAGFNEQMLAHGGRRWAIARRSARNWLETDSVPSTDRDYEYGGAVSVVQ